MSLHKNQQLRILKNQEIKGVVFCKNPQQEIHEKDIEVKREREELKSLEIFWENKGFQLGMEKGVEQGKTEGEKIGYEKGFFAGIQEGQKAGSEKSYLEGFENGQKSLLKKVGDSIDTIGVLLESLKSERESFMENVKPSLLSLVKSICNKILPKKLDDEDSLKQIVENVFDKEKALIKGQNLVVYSSKRDLESFQNVKRILDIDNYKIQDIKVVVDENLKNGNFRIETSLGLINFDIERIIDELIS